MAGIAVHFPIWCATPDEDRRIIAAILKSVRHVESVHMDGDPWFEWGEPPLTRGDGYAAEHVWVRLSGPLSPDLALGVAKKIRKALTRAETVALYIIPAVCLTDAEDWSEEPFLGWTERA